jgi:hypothetical protein
MKAKQIRSCRTFSSALYTPIQPGISAVRFLFVNNYLLRPYTGTIRARVRELTSSLEDQKQSPEEYRYA